MNESSAVVATKKPKAPASAKASRQPRKTQPTVGRSGRSLVQRTDVRDEPATQFAAVLGDQDAAVEAWLRTIHNPAGKMSGVPAGYGSFELYTDKYQDNLSGSAVADSNGTAFVGVAMDSWIESANADGTPLPACQVMGYGASGAMAVSSNGTAPYGALPQAGLAPSALFTFDALQKPDPAINGTTRIRQVACMLSVWSDEPLQTSKGEIVVVSSVNPLGEIQGGGLNGCDYSSIQSTSARTASMVTQSLAGLKSSDRLTAIALPAESMAFDMVLWPLNGYGNVPVFTLAAIAKGMTPSARFQWRIDVCFESEAAKSKRALDASVQPAVKVSVDRLANAVGHSVKYSALGPGDSGLRGAIHALPFIEELAQSNPAAVLALDRHPALRPAHVAAGSKPASSAIYKPSNGSGGGILATIKNIGTGLVKSGVLSAIPYVGPVVQGLASGLLSIFGGK